MNPNTPNRFTGNQYRQAWKPNNYVQAGVNAAGNFIKNTSMGVAGKAAKAISSLVQPRAIAQTPHRSMNKVQQLNKDVSSYKMPFGK